MRTESEAKAQFYATQYARRGNSLAMNSTNGRTITELDEDEEEQQRNSRFGPTTKLRAELRKNNKGPSFMYPLVLVGPSGAGKSTLVKYL